MTINLDPPESLTAFHQRLVHGKLIRIPLESGENNLTGDVLVFQYNPESISRSRAGNWEARNRKRRGQPSPQSTRSRSAQGSSALLADSETISMKIIFDATEAILAGGAAGAEAAREGISQHLAALSLIPMGKTPDSRGQGRSRRQRDAIRPVRPDQLLLVLGERYFPVVLTSLTISEQKFSPDLVPIRAEVDLRMNVLESMETAYSVWIRRAFDHLARQRREKAARAWSGGNETLDAIQAALGPAGSR